MMTLSITPTAFKESERQATDVVVAGPNVRRMTRGIQIKEDTFATLQVVTTANRNIPLVDAGARKKAGGEPITIGDKRATDIYSNFLLQNVTEERVEKQQILETFGEPYIFLFGERARLMSFQGILANTEDFNWEAEWWHNYENYLRGTKCVENDAMAFLHYDNTIVGGYIVATGSQKVAQDKNFVQFQFQMFVTYYAPIHAPGNPFPFPDDVQKGDTNPYPVYQSVQNIDAWRPDLSPLRDFALQLPTEVKSLDIQFPDLLLAVMQAAKNPFKAAWSLAGGASELINGLTQNMSGGVVEVPYGFAGTMAYDDVDLSEFVRAAQNFQGQSGSMLYSDYGSNDDEFVNLSTQYGSVIGADGIKKLSLGATSLDQQITDGDNLVKKAADQWGVAGSVVDKAQEGPLSSYISKNGMGMIFIGTTSDTQRVDVVAGGIHTIPFLGEQREDVRRIWMSADVKSVGLNVSRGLNLTSSLLLGKLTGNPLAPPQYK